MRRDFQGGLRRIMSLIYSSSTVFSDQDIVPHRFSLIQISRPNHQTQPFGERSAASKLLNATFAVDRKKHDKSAS